MADFLNNSREYFFQYTIRQRLLIIGVLLGIISSTITLVMWANRPEYELLYSNLTPESAGAIVEDLRNEDIKFKLENGGKTIYVPQEYISEMRIKFAQSGYISDGVAGYEIFENSNMGMTTFMQKVNLRRALEGELTRTINQFPGVKASRIHLVIPESKLFEEKKQGKASVVLHLNPGSGLSSDQISGITKLVANSVDGIESGDVVVLDSKSNVLGGMSKESEVMGSVGNQWELQSSIEKELQNKVKAIVAGVVGSQNSVVKVSVDMNFDQIERTVEEIDPDNVVPISEKTYTESSFNVDDSSNFTAEDITTNYELSKKQERFVSTPGTIKRVTVAVLVNGEYLVSEDENGEKTSEYIPRKEEELVTIASLVKSAVGYTEERGDVVEVKNLRFSADTSVEDEMYFQDVIQQEMWEKYITYGLLGLAILLGFILVRTLFKSGLEKLALPGGSLPAALPMNTPVANGATLPSGQVMAPGMKIPEPEAEISEDFYIKKLSPEARAKLKAKDRMTADVIEFAKEKPEDTSKLIRSWLTQDKLA